MTDIVQSEPIECPESIVVLGVAIPLVERNHERALYSFDSGNHPSFRVWHWPAHTGAGWFASVGVTRGKLAVSYALSGASIHDVCDSLCAEMSPADWANANTFLCKAAADAIAALSAVEMSEAAQ